MLRTRALAVLLLASAAQAFVPLGSRALAPAARGVPRRDASACAAKRLARRSLVVVEAQPSAPSLEGFDQGGAEPVASVATLDSLVPRTKITELVKQTSDAEGAKQVLFVAACYGLCAALFAASSPIAPLALVARLSMAFVASFNFMPLHECVHRSAFKSRWLNDVVMHVAGFLCLRPAQHYFYYHWGHHKHTGNVELDSELQPTALDMDVSTLGGYLLYISGLPFWFDATTTTLSHALGRCSEPYLASSRAKSEVTLEARVYTLLYASLIAAGTMFPAFGVALLNYWVIPSVMGQPFLRFYLFAEHRGCEENPSSVLTNTRTMKTNWLYRKLAWEMPYHMEHHSWPYVPFHKLKDANALVRAAGGDEAVRGPCSPEGDAGYFSLNMHFIRQLLQGGGKDDSKPSPSGGA